VPVWLCASVILICTGAAKAQSTGAFATRPYGLPVANEGPPTQSSPSIQRQGQGQGQGAPAPYRGPAPVTMFRASPQPVTQTGPEAQPWSTQRPPYSIIAQSQRDALERAAPPPEMEPVQQQVVPPSAPRWNPASLEAVVAPAVVASGPLVMLRPVTQQPDPRTPNATGQRYHRRAVRRIFEDTRTSLTYDMPEALADALPWVDRDRKNEPFEDVLDRVANDLSRAAQSDPEWAWGAQREIRALSKKLDRFPEPPPLQRGDDVTLLAQAQGQSGQSGQASLQDRPFRPRPIWPGASGRPEAQVRPATVVTQTGIQEGPPATGVSAAFVPSAEDGAPQPTSPRARRAPRRTPAAKR
jgi:hypothetical protein